MGVEKKQWAALFRRRLTVEPGDEVVPPRRNRLPRGGKSQLVQQTLEMIRERR